MKEIRAVLLSLNTKTISLEEIATTFKSVLEDNHDDIQEQLSQGVIPLIVSADEQFQRDYGECMGLVVHSCMDAMDKLAEIAPTAEAVSEKVIYKPAGFDSVRLLMNFGQTGSILEIISPNYPDLKFTVLNYGQHLTSGMVQSHVFSGGIQ